MFIIITTFIIIIITIIISKIYMHIYLLNLSIIATTQ